MSVIGFLGLGNMGGPMAANLVRAGHAVQGFDVVDAARQAAAASGIIVRPGAADAVQGCDMVITMLPTGRQVLDLYPHLLEAAAPGTLCIDCSTIDVAECRQAHALADAAGMESLDAPVSGGVSGAAAATLTFMAGGTAQAYARAEPVLGDMGRTLVHCGDAGAGQAAKICNNMILGISMIAVSEAFVLAEKLGLSHAALFRVASQSSGQCWSLTSYCPVPGPVPASPANRFYAPGFAAALMLKDLNLAREAAEASGADTALGREAAAQYAAFVEDGGGGADFSAIIKRIRG